MSQAGRFFENNFDAIEALETQRDQSLRGKPTHGDVLTLDGEEILIHTRGSPEGINIFVYGKITESPYTDDEVLKEIGEEYQDEITEAIGRRSTNTELSFADYTHIQGSGNKDDYLKLNEDLNYNES